MRVKIKTDDGHTITVTGPNAEELLDQIEKDLEELASYRRMAQRLLIAAKEQDSWDNMREHILDQAEKIADITFH